MSDPYAEMTAALQAAAGQQHQAPATPVQPAAAPMQQAAPGVLPAPQGAAPAAPAAPAPTAALLDIFAAPAAAPAAPAPGTVPPQQFQQFQQPQQFQQFQQQPAPAPAAPALAPATGVDANALAQAVVAMQQNNQQQQQALLQLVQTMAANQQVAAQQPAPAPQLPTVNAASLLTAAEAQTFGDMTPVLDRVVNQAITGVVQHLQQHAIAPLQQQLQQAQETLTTQQTQAASRNATAMAAALNAAVPELAQVAHTPQWQAFLNNRMPMATGPVRDVLIQAYNTGNTGVIKEHVQEFLRLTRPAPAPTMAAPAGFPASAGGPAAAAPVAFAPQGVPVPPGYQGGAGAGGVVDMTKVDNIMNNFAAGKMTPDAYQLALDQMYTAMAQNASSVH